MKRLQKILAAGVLAVLAGCETSPRLEPGCGRRGRAGCSSIGRPGERALAWLAHQQKRDGSWGERAENRSELTGLALIAFMSLGEGPASEQYGKRIIRAFERTIEFAKDEKLNANSRSILLYTLVEGWELTLNPLLRDAALDLMIDMSDGDCSPLWAARALRRMQTNGLRNEADCRLRQCGRAFAGKTDLYNQVCHAYCLLYGADGHWAEEFDALGTSDMLDWRLASRPLLTVSMLYDLLYWRGIKKTEDLRRGMIKDVILRQHVNGDVSDEGWWTADGLGVPDDPDAKRFSGNDRTIYVTAVTVPPLWWGSIKPAPSCDAVERPKEEADPDDIRIDTGNL